MLKHPDDQLTRGHTRALMGIAVLYSTKGKVTVRSLGKFLGFKSTYWTHVLIQQLIHTGWITFEKGTAGTIVPRYSFNIFNRRTDESDARTNLPGHEQDQPNTF